MDDNVELKHQIDLQEVFKTISRYKTIMFGVTLLVTLTVLFINLAKPKLYEQQIVIRLTTPAYISNPSIYSAKEFAEILGNIDKRKEEIFQKTKNEVHRVEIKDIKGTKDFLKISIRSENRDLLPKIMDELMQFILSTNEAKRIQDRVQYELQLQIEETAKLLKDSEQMMESVKSAVKGNSKMIGFDPVGSPRKIYEWRKESQLLENERANYSFIKIVDAPRIVQLDRHVLLFTTFTFFSGIIISMFAAFFIVYIRTVKDLK